MQDCRRSRLIAPTNVCEFIGLLLYTARQWIAFLTAIDLNTHAQICTYLEGAFMQLYVVRHGETDYNRARIMQGYQEIPLNDHGISQATELAYRLRDEGIHRVVCSDLRRAVMTGCIIASHAGVPLEYVSELRERNPGVLTEQPYDEEPRFFTDKIYVPPGGESIATFFTRVKRAFEQLVSRPELADERVAVVTHGLVCHAFVTQFFGEDEGNGVGARNASMNVVSYEGGTWRLMDLDTVSHLSTKNAPIESSRELPRGT